MSSLEATPGVEPGPLAAAPRRKRYRVAAVGDSLTDERAGGGRYLAELRDRCPRSGFVSLGRGGDMVNQMRARFERELVALGEPLTHVILFGGVNDLYSDLTAGRTPGKIQADLGAMYAMARARGASVVAVTVAPWAGFKRYFNPGRGVATLQVNRWITEQRADKTVDHVVDAYTLLACSAGGAPDHSSAAGAFLCKQYARKDGLHLSEAGYRRLGEALHRQVFADCE